MAGSTARFSVQKVLYLAGSVSLFLIASLFGFFSSCVFFRLRGDSSGLADKNGEKFNFLRCEEDEAAEFRHGDDGAEEEDEPEVYLKFKFPTYEEFRQIQKERGNDLLNSEEGPSAIGSQYGLPSGGSSVPTIIDERETFPVNIIHDFNKNLEESRAQSVKKSGTDDEEEFVGESDFLDEKHSVSFGCDSELRYSLSHSYSDGFMSEGMDFGDVKIKEESDAEWSKSRDFGDEESELMEDPTKLEQNNQQNPQVLNPSDFLSEKDFNEYEDSLNDADYATKFDATMDGGDDSDHPESDEDSDSLWEHQELIEQLKMELKKVRANGLPTILEESEASPKILMDDLKPWRMDEFRREDCIGELHKFYKSYRERMRKFDIVSYQKTYAMGCLQLKDPLQSLSNKKSSSPTFKSLLSQNLRLFKNKIHGTDPMNKFIREVQDDLEAVYVAHMCLSWEFLQWQYDKALDLWDSDPRGIRRYNEVAGEFQQFQVLMQRFIEDEPFQGPRMQHYVNTRRVHRNLLQVPVIRQDKNLKDGKKTRKEHRDEYVITSEMLVEILEESIRIFWRFVRADNDGVTDSHKKLPDVPSTEDLKLLTEAKKILQKKERKLRDLLRSENCILRKFRRSREGDDYDQVLWFFSQVDLRLAARTLNMSKMTKEQLIWCHNKMDRISFVDRKIHVEPAFLLFPC